MPGLLTPDGGPTQATVIGAPGMIDDASPLAAAE
jgi:hypothetical protein